MRLCVWLLLTGSTTGSLNIWKKHFKNGKLSLPVEEFDFENEDYFDLNNIQHLHSVLENNPMREANKQVR